MEQRTALRAWSHRDGTGSGSKAIRTRLLPPASVPSATRCRWSKRLSIENRFCRYWTMHPLRPNLTCSSSIWMATITGFGKGWRLATGRVVVIEYNATVGPHLQWVMPYNPNHRWNDTAWHGAGLAALARLGRSLGYVLVGCDSHGVNAFFVLRRDAWRFSAASVRDRWVPPRYSLPYGHPIRPFGEFDVRPVPDDSDANIVLRASPPRLTTVNPGQILYLDVIVTNETDQPIGCSGDKPLQLCYSWLDEDGRRLVEEPVRCRQLWRSAPNASCNLLCRTPAPKESGTYSLVLGIVQEGVRWLDESNVTVGKWNVRPQ